MNPPAMTIRPKLTMKKMSVQKVEEPILNTAFDRRKLDYYRQLWDALSTFRKESEKAVKYFNGDQWHELTTDDRGRTMREDDNIMAQGKVPLKQNLIKSTIRTLLGLFRTDTSMSSVLSRTPDKGKESEMLSNLLQYSLTSVNNSKDLDARALEEFLNTGLAVQRIYHEYIPELGKKDTLLRNRNRNSIFFNGDSQDIRGYDIRIIGELIDATIEESILNFGTTPERTKELKDIFSMSQKMFYSTVEANDPEVQYNKDFYICNDFSKCRIINVWEKRLVEQMYVHDWMNGEEWYCDWTEEHLKQANAIRIKQYAEMGTAEEDVPIMEGTPEKTMKFFSTYYSPFGHVLREEETPFEHGSHPFIMLAYPLLDGKITGLTTDLIDANRQVNRLLIMQDMILGSSVKNTLIFDEDALDGKSLEQAGNEYKKIGGVVSVKLKAGQKLGDAVLELKGSVGNMGIAEMIQIYIRMLQDVSGVQSAMQGQTANSGTSGKLYDAQISQSTLNSKDIMDTFTGLFRRNRDMKLLQTLQQYTTQPTMIAVSGKSYTETAQLYDPQQVRDVKYDLVIGQSPDSPVYRSIIEDRLASFVDKGLIDLKMFLESTTMPYSQKLLESIRKREEEAQGNQQQVVAGLPQAAQQAGVPQGDPNVINAVSQGLKVA